MSGIRTNAAATMLGVSPNTLRSWERRYGYPFPDRSAGGHRLYDLGEIEALRATLGDTQNVSSAISVARERGAGPSSSSRLSTAFAAFEEEAADRLLEESLMLRSFERTIEDLLIPAVAALTPGSADFEFGARHASAWIAAVNRLSPRPSRPEAVLVLDGSARVDIDALNAQALELMLRRSGMRTLALSTAVELTRLGRAVRAIQPVALVLSGHQESLDGIGRIVFSVRGVVPGIPVYDFRGAVPSTGATTVTRLGEHPIEARDRLVAEFSPRSIAARHRSASERERLAAESAHVMPEPAHAGRRSQSA